MADPMQHEQDPHEEDDAMLGPDEAEEIVEDDGDAAMDSGDEDEEQVIQLQNDSIAHFDAHKNSVFCIAQHPTKPELIATGAGDDIAYVWDSTPPEGPVLPTSYETDPQPRERQGQQIIAKLEGQDESVNAICFTLPKGEYVVTATLAGKLNAYITPDHGRQAQTVGSAKEVDEINWLLPSPNPQYPNTIAFGAGDGSVWIYTINAKDTSSPLTIVQTFFLHQGPCTAGAWTPDGKLLATVSEDGSLYVWDVFGDAAAAGIADPNGGQAILSLTADDERFKVDGGLYSATISPSGRLLAVGGAEGNIRVITLPRLSAVQQQAAVSAKGGKAGGGKQAPTQATAGNAGQIVASLRTQSDGVETLDFSNPPYAYLAAGSVDGSIAIFDAKNNFAVRRHIKGAHQEEEVEQAVIKVEFVKLPVGTANPLGHILTSCGNDGVVRRWDLTGGTAGQGLLGEWKGHRGEGEGGGILGFVQGGGGKRVVTAGDDNVSLVFDAMKPPKVQV